MILTCRMSGGLPGYQHFDRTARAPLPVPIAKAIAGKGVRIWTLNGPGGQRVTTPGPFSCYGSDHRSLRVPTIGQAMTPAPLPVYQPASLITLPSANS